MPSNLDAIEAALRQLLGDWRASSNVMSEADGDGPYRDTLRTCARQLEDTLNRFHEPLACLRAAPQLVTNECKVCHVAIYNAAALRGCCADCEPAKTAPAASTPLEPDEEIDWQDRAEQSARVITALQQTNLQRRSDLAAARTRIADLRRCLQEACDRCGRRSGNYVDWEEQCGFRDELAALRAELKQLAEVSAECAEELAAAKQQLHTIAGTASHVKLVKLADGIDGLDARLCDAVIRWHDEFCELKEQLGAANVWIGTCKNHDPYTAAWTVWKLRAEKAKAENERLLAAYKDTKTTVRLYHELCDRHGCPADESQFSWLDNVLSSIAAWRSATGCSTPAEAAVLIPKWRGY